MTFRMTINAPAWQAHLAEVVGREAGVVPVIKGRGYGLGTALLARQAEHLGVDTVAVGTAGEAGEVLQSFSGDAIVLEPFCEAEVPASDGVHARTVRTLGRMAAVDAVLDAAGAGDVGPFVVEIDSSMHRHGVQLSDIAKAGQRLRSLAGTLSDPGPMRGFALHLPVRGGPKGELAHVAAELAGLGWTGTTLWVSHAGTALMREVSGQVPALRLRERVGTRLWLGRRDALAVTGTVIDVREVSPGTKVGYARWRSRAARLLVVTGGTAHGVGLYAEPAIGARSQLVGLGRRGVELAGVRLSPFSWQGHRLRFVDTPHMQVSMLALPKGVEQPAVGTSISCAVRMTISTFDAVDLVGGGLSVESGRMLA